MTTQLEGVRRGRGEVEGGEREGREEEGRRRRERGGWRSRGSMRSFRLGLGGSRYLRGQGRYPARGVREEERRRRGEGRWRGGGGGGGEGEGRREREDVGRENWNQKFTDTKDDVFLASRKNNPSGKMTEF
jgi:hypothetical protein